MAPNLDDGKPPTELEISVVVLVFAHCSGLYDKGKGR